MALAESPRFIDHHEVPKPHEKIISLPFGGNALVVNLHEIMFWASLAKEPEVAFRSLILHITTDMRIITPRDIESGLRPDSYFKPGTVHTFPARISRNPKRNWFYLEPNYEIDFQNATGVRGGDFIIKLKSKNPILMEPILKPPDMNEELRRRKAMHSAQNMLR